MTYRTDGEAEFGGLLDERGLSFTYEPSFPKRVKSPDFRIELADSVICEVKDFALNDEEKGINLALENNGSAAWSQEKPYSRIRNKALEDKADQLKEYADHPSVIVIRPYRFGISTVNLSNQNLFECLYGDLTVIVERDESGLPRPKTTVNRSKAFIRWDKNTHVSAIAVMDHDYRPNMKVADSIARELVRGGVDLVSEDGQKKLESRFEEAEKGGIDLELAVQRLRIIHNRWASKPLPLGTFQGKFDQEIYFDDVDLVFKEVYNGVTQNYPSKIEEKDF